VIHCDILSYTENEITHCERAKYTVIDCSAMLYSVIHCNTI